MGIPYRKSSPVRAIILLTAALGLFLPGLINGGPLYYFDSAAYLDAGLKLLEAVGIHFEPAAAAGAQEGAVTEFSDDGVINGSRSLAYSLIVTLSAGFLFPGFIVILQGAAAVVTIYGVLRVIARRELPELPVVDVLACVLIGAGLTSLGFYVAYFMPDIFAPLMLILLALVTVFHKDMSIAELVVVTLALSFCIVSHPSHFLIGALMVPIMLAGTLLLRKSALVPVLVVGAALLVQVGERMALSYVATAKYDSEVVYFPFLTARLIQDEIGYDYLEERCPEAGIATCILYQRLSVLEDPLARKASHIVFDASPETGSFLRLSADNKRAIAEEQVAFAVKVALAKPVGMFMAIASNTLHQVGRFSVDMTLPTDPMPSLFDKLHQQTSLDLRPGNFWRYGPWVANLDAFHGVVYLISLGAIISLLVWPGAISPRLRVFTLIILAGILVNAFVCGAVSQPANRYGARVSWLLPFLAVLLAWATWQNRRSAEAGRHG